MKSAEERVRLNAISRDVIGSAFRVSNTLGHGFLERVYENALALELQDGGRNIVQQVPVEVLYKERVVGEYRPDMIVDGGVVVEIKAIDTLEECHLSQCLNYLRVTGQPVAILLNFGRPKIQYRRIVWGF